MYLLYYIDPRVPWYTHSFTKRQRERSKDIQRTDPRHGRRLQRFFIDRYLVVVLEAAVNFTPPRCAVIEQARSHDMMNGRY